MDLTGILSISGYGGLFKLIKQTKTGFIVESLIDKKRMQAFASSKISTLEDIAIYTETGEMHLKDVLRKIFQHENEQKLSLTAKSSGEELKSFLEKVLPDYDKERVYVSDIKKVVLWYNLLLEQGMIDLEEDEPEEEEKTDNEKETSTEEDVEKAAKKKKASSKIEDSKVGKIKDSTETKEKVTDKKKASSKTEKKNKQKD
jgi:hypothetical protein